MRTFAIALLTCAFALAADSPFVGTWKMNKSKSTIDPKGQQYDSLTVQFLQEGSTLKSIPTVNGTVVPATVMDGKEHAVPAGTLSRLGATHYVSTVNGKTIETVFKRDGKIFGTRKTSLSPDGKSSTSVTEATLPDGQKTHTTIVFEKQ